MKDVQKETNLSVTDLSVTYRTKKGTGTMSYDFMAYDTSNGVTLEDHLKKSIVNRINLPEVRTVEIVNIQYKE